MRFLIIDLEATCWDNATREQRNQMETIEIGCAVVEPYSLELLDQIDIIVKPVFHPKLTNFCIDLTSITQEMVDSGESFRDAMKKISSYTEDDDIFCSWGLFDCKLLTRQCRQLTIEYPFKNGHANIKNVVAQSIDRKPSSVIKTCNFLNVDFKGRMHRGIDDALNMRKILEKSDDYLQNKDAGVTITSLIIEAAEKSKEIADYPFFGEYYGR